MGPETTMAGPGFAANMPRNWPTMFLMGDAPDYEQPPAPGDGFEKNGVAHAVREGLRLGGFFDGFVDPGNGRNIDAAGKLAAGSFGAERFHGVGWRPDEGETRIRAGAWQRGIFRQKPIAGVQGIATGAARDIHELVDAEIAFARRRGANGIGFIGEADVKRFAIHITEDGDRADT